MITLRMELNRRRLRLLVDVCESPRERARGLLFRPRLRPGHVMLIPACSAVHTLGLWYRLDLAFCNADGTILRIVRSLGPCRTSHHRGAAHVWEMTAGTADALELQPGDRLVAR